jgi:hypothetical protein
MLTTLLDKAHKFVNIDIKLFNKDFYDTTTTTTNNNNNSILYYLCAESTATRPITDPAQCRYK